MVREERSTPSGSLFYEQFARIGKALAAAGRVELLDLLCQGERSVEALAHASGMTVTNTSQHLQVLRATALVEAHKDEGDLPACRRGRVPLFPRAR